MEWIRVGSLKKQKNKDHSGKEKELWLVLARLCLEKDGATAPLALAWWATAPTRGTCRPPGRLTHRLSLRSRSFHSATAGRNQTAFEGQFGTGSVAADYRFIPFHSATGTQSPLRPNLRQPVPQRLGHDLVNKLSHS
jgi:hypothetical protein